MMADGAKEAPLRKKLEQYLPQIFPDLPWWVKVHAEGAEKHTQFVKSGSLSYGFVDTLVGATSIEYEPNLLSGNAGLHAEGQVRDYVAGQVNEGVSIDIMIGVTSDTLRWRAFRPRLAESASGKVGRDDIELETIEAIDLSSPVDQDATELVRFLTSWLGRSGSRPLIGRHLANDLGIESSRGASLRDQVNAIESAIRIARPGYGEMIDRLWSELVDAIGSRGNRNLGRQEYLDEFYLLTLAKLICANVLDREAKNRSDDEICAILDGAFFSDRGLDNYVEYDLFGWLSEKADQTGLLDLAREIQNDLIAYDFRSIAPDDLFGELLARLGHKSTRLILGQELTPPWLAARMVQKVVDDLGEVPLRAVDMSCGSGTILVEMIRAERSRIVSSESGEQRAQRISGSATGFDIDPLAALFAKTNWVIAMRDELPHLGDATIPVFHADSLFAGLWTPDAEHFTIRLDDKEVAPPKSLLTPEGQRTFDELLSSSYREAMRQAGRSEDPETSAARPIIEKAAALANDDDLFDLDELEAFAAKLIEELATLQKAGRNGLWAYVIRNTSRAEQSHKRFNSLIINPPWLSISKLADNPYGGLLGSLAAALGVRPAGQSFFHPELASVFLLEGVRRYLEDGGRFACIVPSTMAEGHHQNRFRRGEFASSARKVNLDVDAIWQVSKSTFKNEAVVLHGSKSPFSERENFPGASVHEGGATALEYRSVTATYPSGERRVIWSTNDGKAVVGFGLEPAPFRQGADLMPRTTWFHYFSPFGKGRFKADPISSDSDLWYLLNDSKKAKDFRLPAGTIVDSQFVVDALISKQLIPFEVLDPDRMLIPGKFEYGEWVELSSGDLAVASAGTSSAFSKISKELGKNTSSLFKLVNTMDKLRKQDWDPSNYLVFVGAGGSNPCAAWVEPGRMNSGSIVFDQTVYWAPVGGKDEAAFIAGAINSPACAEIIAPFQPSGAKGKRHVHKLAISVVPTFGPNDATHTKLAKATLALVDAWKSWAAANPEDSGYVRSKHNDLSWRRRKTLQAMKALPEWAAYLAATEAVFGD